MASARRGRAAATVAGAALACAALPCAAADDADDSDARGRPRWEAGLVAGGGRFADYPGAEQAHTRALVAPFVVYRGPLLRIDREGVRGRLFDSPDLELDIAASAAFNARDNDARAGMPGLDYLLGVGPQLVWRGWRDRPGRPSVHLKLRGIVSTDFGSVHGRGYTLAPLVRWRFAERFSFELQPTWASRTLQRYFYEVPPAYATAERPAYRARAGYLGTEANLGYVRRIDQAFSWFAGVRALSLHGAANGASPLLRRDLNVSVGAGIVWTPWRSREPALD